MSSLGTLEARVRAAAFRVRAMRVAEAGVRGSSIALGIASLVRLAQWFWPGLLASPNHGALAALLIGIPAAAAIAASSREIQRLPVLDTLDRTHGLSDLLSSAWALSQLPPALRGPLVEITIARAERAAGGLEIRRSFPWRRPRGLGWLAGVAAAATLVWLGLHPQPSAAVILADHEASRPLERLVSPAQLARFRARLARIDLATREGEQASAVRSELDTLLDEIERAPADRLHVLRRLGELEHSARLTASGKREGADAHPSVAGDTTRGHGTARDGTEPPAEAESATPLEHVQPPAPPAPAAAAAPPALETPAPAVASQPPAAEPPEPEQPQAQARAEQRQADRESSAPDPTNPQSPQPPAGRSSSPPAAKEARPVAASRSQAGGGDNQAPGPELERHRVPDRAERQRGQNLAEAISELRDLMRRDESVHADLGEPGQSPRQPGRDRPADPERDDSAGNRPGAPNAAYARGGPPRVGTEGDSKSEDLPKLPAAATRVSGAQSAGPVRSQVIYGAAERGFASRDYARVHAEYEDHAERELEREDVPPGYRSYVRRYFEAIAPRRAP